MAKVEFQSTPKSAYEVAVVTGGGSMSDAQRAALLDEFVEESGLVPVETTFHGETPTHLYGRYKAGYSAPANALAPTATGTTEDVAKLKAEKSDMEQELARLRAQLGKQAEKKEGDDVPVISGGIGSASISTTDDAREALNQSDDYNLAGASEEVREDMSTADRSDDNPKVDAPRRGRPPKDAK